jgi:hypothetical protein
MKKRLAPFYALIAIFTLTAGICSKDDPTGPSSNDLVDLFPVPITDASSLFPSVDDAFLNVSFTMDFEFPFYGTSYNSVYLNTNGGLTFGSGNSSYDEASNEVTYPGIAVFWGDMDASAYEADTRAHQMTYQQYSDRFVVTYTQFQDNDDVAMNNTATLTLYDDGRIIIQYGAVLSDDILIGVWDGTHTSDIHTDAATMTFTNFDGLGTGVILHDYWNEDASYDGRYNSHTVTFNP